MPFVETDMEQEVKELQIMVETDPELQAAAKEFDREYELRKKRMPTRKVAGLTQTE